MRSQGGFNRPRVDHTGKEYRGFSVIGLGKRHRDLVTWSCRCAACGRSFSVTTSAMSAKIRNGHGCGCRHGELLRASICKCGGRSVPQTSGEEGKTNA